MLIVPVVNDEEIDGVVSLADEIWREHYIPIIGRAQVDYMLRRFQSREAIGRQISEERYRYFLTMTHESLPLGYFSVQPQDDEMFLSKIYVRVAERGNGYGREALGFIERMAAECGLKKIFLTVNKNNRLAIDAYLRFGFIIDKPVVQDIGNGYVMDDYLMIKVVRSQLSQLSESSIGDVSL